MAAQKYTGHFSNDCARAVCHNRGCKLGVNGSSGLFWLQIDLQLHLMISKNGYVLFLLSLLSLTALPDHPEAGLEDERCPLMTGCDRAGGQCVCDARHSCLGSFTYPDQETCIKASKSGEAFPSVPRVCIHSHVHRM